MAGIYILRKGETEKFGPFEQDQVNEMLNEGQLTTEDLFWREGMKEWVPLDGLPDDEVTVAPETLALLKVKRWLAHFDGKNWSDFHEDTARFVTPTTSQTQQVIAKLDEQKPGWEETAPRSFFFQLQRMFPELEKVPAVASQAGKETLPGTETIYLNRPGVRVTSKVCELNGRVWQVAQISSIATDQAGQPFLPVVGAVIFGIFGIAGFSQLFSGQVAGAIMVMFFGSLAVWCTFRAINGAQRCIKISAGGTGEIAFASSNRELVQEIANALNRAIAS